MALTYSPIIQISAMKRYYPHFTGKQTKEGYLFTGELQPKDYMPKYKVSILYRGSLNPIVRVISPKLVENPPHFYKKIRALCLYRPDLFKWKKGNLIAVRIVHLISAWLYFYEIWKNDPNHIWYGPEASHDIPESSK